MNISTHTHTETKQYARRLMNAQQRELASIHQRRPRGDCSWDEAASQLIHSGRRPLVVLKSVAALPPETFWMPARDSVRLQNNSNPTPEETRRYIQRNRAVFAAAAQGTSSSDAAGSTTRKVFQIGGGGCGGSAISGSGRGRGAAATAPAAVAVGDSKTLDKDAGGPQKTLKVCETCFKLECRDHWDVKKGKRFQDKKFIKRKALYLGISSLAGIGVFAGQDIANGDFIGNYVGEICSRSEAEDPCRAAVSLAHSSFDPRGTSKTSFHMDIAQAPESHNTIDALRVGDVLKFANCGYCRTRPRANMKVFEANQTVSFYAMRDIKCGEELLFPYGGQFNLLPHFD